ncbi:uncharacterized protein DFL_005701 [Arthrobotrys flagrans]|uniref:non-specific serine/threonine protein kinase n=1 Tax=Arthrobotrys flagrans TaxID=97331 RepID=A0A436ZYL8_ARTFL|nr:hypothetical protein DFL_005701 [Arthrobotrys flagrans]
MEDRLRSKIIEENPIGKGLDAFRASFNESRGILFTSDVGSGTNLLGDLGRLISTVNSGDFDPGRIQPLLNAALSDSSDDTLIWDQVYNAVTESTPPRSIPASTSQTPWVHKTSSIVNTSEHHKNIDALLKEELGPIYVGLRNFHATYFGGVAGLETAAEAVFSECRKGSKPLFDEGWSAWPQPAGQDNVIKWFTGIIDELAAFAKSHTSVPTRQRRLLANPNKPIDGSVAQRKMGVGFVNSSSDRKDSKYHWSQILVPGELKSNPAADNSSETRYDLGKYAREVLAAQDTRRFVLGFTICGSLMRVWEFDRLGAIASEPFDINKDGRRFVFTILGFLCMDEEQLGFDPTIVTLGSERYIEIKRNDRTERLIIDKVVLRARCIAGRATTCWKAHREGDSQTPLVIKDSWQYPEREEEGELLRKATDEGVVNVARYYYHETVRVRGEVDNIQGNVRGGLDITEATNYGPDESVFSPSTRTAGPSQKGRSNSTAGVKRSASRIGAPPPPSKRSCSAPSTEIDSALPNRVHRRVILRDYGKPIYRASSRAALLAALEGCIEGHESLYKAGFLHRDISINNLMINEDQGNLSWPSFLIDLDLAIKEEREGVTRAKGKTGTRAFMATGVLLGEVHSFMHDLESFF